jgi:hypothetical protein
MNKVSKALVATFIAINFAAASYWAITIFGPVAVVEYQEHILR